MDVYERFQVVKVNDDNSLVDLQQIPTVHFNGRILVVTDVRDALPAIKELLADGAREYGVGLDLEWRPSFRANVDPPIALIQLSTENVCVLFCMLKMREMPEALRSLLECDDIVKIGAAVDREDSAKLYYQYGITLGKTYDVCEVATRLGFRKIGIANLVKALLGAKMDKKCQMSNWAAYHLSMSQIRYAATDAYMSLMLYYKLRAIETILLLVDHNLVNGNGNKPESAVFINRALTQDRLAPLAELSKLVPPHLTINLVPARPQVKSYPCPNCGGLYISAEALDSHILREHIPLCCEACNKELPNAAALLDHIRYLGHYPLELAQQLQRGYKTFYCRMCNGRTFNNINGAAQHFVQKHQLAQHMEEKVKKESDNDDNGLPDWMPTVSCDGTGIRTIVFNCGHKTTTPVESPALVYLVPGLILQPASSTAQASH